MYNPNQLRFSSYDKLTAHEIKHPLSAIQFKQLEITTGNLIKFELRVVFRYSDAAIVTCPVNLIAASEKANDKLINLKEYIIMPSVSLIQKPGDIIQGVIIECWSKFDFDFKITYEYFSV